MSAQQQMRDARKHTVFPSLRAALMQKRREIRGEEDKQTLVQRTKDVWSHWKQAGTLVWSRGFKLQSRARKGVDSWNDVKVDVLVTPRDGGDPTLHKDVPVGRDVEIDWLAIVGPASGTPRSIPRQGEVTPLPVPDMSQKPVIMPPKTAKDKRLVKAFEEMSSTKKTTDGWEFWLYTPPNSPRSVTWYTKGPDGVTNRSKDAFMQKLGLLHQPTKEW